MIETAAEVEYCRPGQAVGAAGRRQMPGLSERPVKRQSSLGKPAVNAARIARRELRDRRAGDRGIALPGAVKLAPADGCKGAGGTLGLDATLAVEDGGEARDACRVIAIASRSRQVVVAAAGARQGEVPAGLLLACQGGAAGEFVAAIDLGARPVLEVGLVLAAEIGSWKQRHGRFEWSANFEILVPQTQ
jgi:hypothetical protein